MKITQINSIISEVYDYLCAIQERSDEEIAFIEKLELIKDTFPVLALDREVLNKLHYDTLNLTDADIRKIAKCMTENISNSEYTEALHAACKNYDVPHRLKCPNCKSIEKAIHTQARSHDALVYYECDDCGHFWNENKDSGVFKNQ